MIKVYGMSTCKDCILIKDELEKRKNEFEFIDIGTHVHKLKEFLKLRDENSIFDEVKKNNKVGIPCFVLEDGRITLDPSDVKIETNNQNTCKQEEICECC